MSECLAHYIDQTLRHYVATRASSAAHTYRSHAKILTNSFGHMKPDELTTRAVEEWAGQARATTKPATVIHRLNFLSHVYYMLDELGIDVPNPVKKARKPRIRNGRTRWLTEDEEAAIMANLEPEERLILRFAILTGLRRIELFSLQRENVDLAARLIQFEGSKETKTRAVPLTDEAMAILKAQIASRPDGPLFGIHCKDRVAAGSKFSRRFIVAVAKAGLKGVTFHTARHTFASRLVQRGVSLLVVQTLLGHVNPQMTMRYSHLQARNLREAVDQLSPPVARVVPTPEPAPEQPAASPLPAPPEPPPAPPEPAAPTSSTAEAKPTRTRPRPAALPAKPQPAPSKLETVTFGYLPGRGW